MDDHVGFNPVLATRRQRLSFRILARRGEALFELVEAAVDPLPGHRSDVYMAVVERAGASQVLRGENRGRYLHHVAIVRRVEALGKCNGRAPFVKQIAVEDAGNAKFRLVAFVQDGGDGPVRGAAVLDATDSR